MIYFCLLANSVDHDEMLHSEVFCLVLLCLHKYMYLYMVSSKEKPLNSKQQVAA